MYCTIYERLFPISDEENDEDQNGLYYLPAAPEVDDPEEAYNPDVRNFPPSPSKLSRKQNMYWASWLEQSRGNMFKLQAISSLLIVHT